jgi:hypothetical protein
MGFFPKKQKSSVSLYGANSVESGGSLDVESGAALKIGGVTVSSSAAELNLSDQTSQAMVENGAINIKNGVVTLAKTVAGALAVTLADPTATTDDFKRLVIVALQAQANTVTIAGGLSGGGAGTDVGTFAGAIGNSVELIAFNGKWHCAGNHGVTFA